MDKSLSKDFNVKLNTHSYIFRPEMNKVSDNFKTSFIDILDVRRTKMEKELTIEELEEVTREELSNGKGDED